MSNASSSPTTDALYCPYACPLLRDAAGTGTRWARLG
jgi:hypothetical protein